VAVFASCFEIFLASVVLPLYYAVCSWLTQFCRSVCAFLSRSVGFGCRRDRLVPGDPVRPRSPAPLREGRRDRKKKSRRDRSLRWVTPPWVKYEGVSQFPGNILNPPLDLGPIQHGVIKVGPHTRNKRGFCPKNVRVPTLAFREGLFEKRITYSAK